jgi:ATP-dependent Clp protease ATP-binding subunit ClpA
MAKGGFIDFKNTLILLTTNVGTDLIMGMCKDPELLPDPEGWQSPARTVAQGVPAGAVGTAGDDSLLSAQR